MLTRRNFLGALVGAAAAALGAAWGSLARARRSQTGLSRVALALPTADGVAFERDVVLVCPCHGSRFDLAGRRLSGPASSGLRPLVIEKREKDGRVDVALAP